MTNLVDRTRVAMARALVAVVELHAVVLFTANREWRFELRKNAAPFHTFEDLKSHLCHVTPSSVPWAWQNIELPEHSSIGLNR